MNTENLISGSVGVTITFLLAILYKVYTTLNHHRIRSNCCGRQLVASVDVEQTTPPTPRHPPPPSIPESLPPIKSPSN